MSFTALFPVGTNGPAHARVVVQTSDAHRIPPPPPGQQVIEEQRRRLAELKQRAAAEAQCQWEALHGSQLITSSSPSPSYSPILAYSPTLSHTSLGPPPLVHHSILHHQPPSAGEQPYDTLSLESSDSMDTSVSTGNNSACSPDNMSGYDAHMRLLMFVCSWCEHTPRYTPGVLTCSSVQTNTPADHS